MRYVGGSSELVTDFDFEVVAQMVLEDAKRDGRDMRIISSYDSAINSNEYRMAIHTSNDDYHFMLQHSDGTWSHKPGAGKTRLINMGHIPGEKYSEMHQLYMDDVISKEEFLEWYRNPDNYRPELPSTNRGHKYE